MAFDFPSSPTLGQQFTPAGGPTYYWNGYAWAMTSTAGVQPLAIRVITSTQAYIPTVGMATAIVEVIGGGGGGGSAEGNWGAGGGGGSGAYSKRFLTAAQIDASQMVTIGAGGNGGTTSTEGTAGTDTSFGSLVIARGGGLGTYCSISIGKPGYGGNGGSTVGGVGDVVSAGQAGGSGSYGTGNGNSGGSGGTSVYGGGGGSPAQTGPGQTSGSYGGGGGGASTTSGWQNGGAGSAGVCIVTEFGPGQVGAVSTNIKVVTASGTYVPSGGLVSAIVEVVGGGGGAGGVSGAAGSQIGSSAGGSGGYSRRSLTAAQIGASQAITIGAAGTGGANGSTNGGNGGTTSFGTLVIANGGLGGGATGLSNAGGAGAVVAGAVGDVVAPGSAGEGGNNNPYFTHAGVGAPSILGGGGASPYGGSSTAIAGSAGVFGAGGGGAFANASVGVAAGGNGGAGVCIITEFIAAAAPQVATVAQRTVLTVGSGTYNTPSGCVYLEVEMVAGGGGGSGGNNNTGPAASGTATTFGSLTCNPGTGGRYINNVTDGLGGTASGGDINITGGNGNDAQTFSSGTVAVGGGAGGSSRLGSGGAGRYFYPGFNGAGYGSGGGGGGTGANSAPGGQGGGAGGYLKKAIQNPVGTYAWGVGTGGNGSGGSGGGQSGGNGAPGVIIVTAYVLANVAIPAQPLGSRILIASQTVSSAVASVNFANGIDATYDEYVLDFYNVRAASTDAVLGIQISQDGGATWKAGASDYAYGVRYVGHVGVANDTQVNGAPYIFTTQGLPSASTGGAGAGTVKFWKPGESAYHLFQVDTVSHQSSIGFARCMGDGAYTGNTGPINGVRLLCQGVNLASGTFNLYGIKK